jgi:hypothetical protein
MAIRKVNAITGRVAQKQKKPAAAGSCQPSGYGYRQPRRVSATAWRQRNTFGAERRLFAALIDLPSAPRPAQIAVICMSRLTRAEHQRMAQNEGDLVWAAAVRTGTDSGRALGVGGGGSDRNGQRPGPWWARPRSGVRR